MTVPNFVAKASVQAVVALLLVLTACGLAVIGRFEDAKSFATLATIPVLWLFRQSPDK